MPRVRMTDEELRRILASESTGSFDPGHLRVLLASGGGDNALAAGPLAFGLAGKSDAPVKIVHVAAERSLWSRILHPRRRPLSGNVTEQIETFRGLAAGKAPEIVLVTGPRIARAICDEAQRGVDVIIVGSGEGASVGGAIVEELVREAPCHVAIMKAPVRSGRYRRILVPVDGSLASRVAVELALRYAEATGAELVLAVLTERRPQAAAYADLSGVHAAAELRATADEELQRISVAFRASDIKPTIVHLAFDPGSSAVSEEVERGQHDLVVLGAENRAIQHRLFFGYENERLIRATRVAVVVVVPNLMRLAGVAR
jgi:nucleotide-binding universal stress UspA family protein